MSIPEDKVVYLDNSATTALAPEVLKAMIPWLNRPANSGSAHRLGRAARVAVEAARESVAAFLGATPAEIVFTSGGTESDALAVFGRARAGGPLACSAIEHPAVLESVRLAAVRAGVAGRILPVDAGGRVDLQALDEVLAARPALVSIMYGNNETGAVQPVADIARRCRAAGVAFHTDAVQAAPFLPLDHEDLADAFITIAGHKIHGPQGVGALRIPVGWPLDPVHVGGGQEGRRRAGTVNVAGVVGLGVACALVRAAQPESARHGKTLRDRLEAGVLAALAEVGINSGEGPRLPHITNLAFAHCDSEELLRALDGRGIAASSGAACAAGSAEASPVLRAMGQSHGQARSALRFSLSRYTTEAEIEEAVSAIVDTVAAARRG